MQDLFDNPILCRNCKKEMQKMKLVRNGFPIRFVQCAKCGEKIVHPGDVKEFEQFKQLKQKEFNVKMRMVGNSYAVSIPREIVDFMHEQEKMMNDMVRLCFEQAGKLSLMFNMPKTNEEDEEESEEEEEAE